VAVIGTAPIKPETEWALFNFSRDPGVAGRFAGACRRLRREAISDLQDVDICQITPSVLEEVIALLETYPLRAMDGLHVGCAQVVAPEIFVSADHRQLAAARKVGLKVVDVS
jgi:predicted nucleic acid-binding protein